MSNVTLRTIVVVALVALAGKAAFGNVGGPMQTQDTVPIPNSEPFSSSKGRTTQIIFSIQSLKSLTFRIRMSKSARASFIGREFSCLVNLAITGTDNTSQPVPCQRADPAFQIPVFAEREVWQFCRPLLPPPPSIAGIRETDPQIAPPLLKSKHENKPEK